MSHFKEAFSARESNLKEMFKLKISHNPSDGRFREDLVKTVLEVIPQRYSVGNGFVVDSKGRLSKEIDIIIYDDVYVPRFFINTYSVIPIESVVAIIQVKTKIDLSKLNDAIDNLNSIDILEAVKGGKIISVGEAREIEEQRYIMPLKILVCGTSTTTLDENKCSDIDIVYSIGSHDNDVVLIKEISSESLVSKTNSKQEMLSLRKNNKVFNKNSNNKLYRFSLAVMKYLTLINNSMIVNYDEYSKGAE